MMRRSAIAFLTASLLVHVGFGGAGVWLAKHPRKDESKGEPKVVLAGETFDIASTSEEQQPREVVTEPTEARPEEHAAEPARPKVRVTSHGEGTTHAVDVPLTYGALGDRSAVDVTVALARGFPQAASTDPIWRDVPFGDAGSAVLEIDLAEDGTLARWSLGAGATPALREGIRRTMAFIGGRTFLARGRTTRLHVTAHVSTDATRDGAEAVYAIHSEHEGDAAKAYFSLSVGRRVDLVITAAR